MLTALLDGERSRPVPKMRGECPYCGSEMIARCGEVKIHHWAHKSTENCDPWWENETNWHLAWKNQFPLSWQEVIHTDSETGERHIADIVTIFGMGIEVQHSRLEPAERRARETFYKNLVWIVDGSRLAGDREKIKDWKKHAKTHSQLKDANIWMVKEPESIFPSDWVNSPVPVCFDYAGPNADADADPQPMFVLYPDTAHGHRPFEVMTKHGMLQSVFANRLTPSACRGIIASIRRIRIRR